LVSPDTHFTQAAGVPDTEKNKRGVADMNALPGVAYPGGTGVVHTIRGVVVPGDLIDDGCSNAADGGGCIEQLANYTAVFGVHPGEGGATASHYPTFDGVGNHDGGNSTDTASGLVRREVIARNRRRDAVHAKISNYSLASNGLHYSWDWAPGLHSVMLNLYPGTEGDCASSTGLPGTGCLGAPYGWHSPEHSLDFLIADLAERPVTTPTILYMHYGIQGFGAPGQVPWAGYSPDFWWSTREAAAFAKAIAPYNIVALVHGHTHACVFYQWDLSNVTGKVYPVFNAPALQKGGPSEPQSTPSQYLAFQVDPLRGKLAVYQRVGSGWGAIQYHGTFHTAVSNGTGADVGLDAAMVVGPAAPAAVGAVRIINAGQGVVPLHVVV
jgi:hypothetical protein